MVLNNLRYFVGLLLGRVNIRKSVVVFYNLIFFFNLDEYFELKKTYSKSYQMSSYNNHERLFRNN